MKKILLYAAAMTAMFACNKPEVDVQTPVENPVSEEKIWVEFTTGAMTKVTREDVTDDPDIKHKFVWEENDAITINGETFTTTESGDKVTFGAEVEPEFLNAETYNAIYPATAGEAFAAITVEDTYEIIPESGFYGIYAVASSENKSFQFKHLTSFVRFQVPAAVSEVTISAEEALAGVVSVAMTDGAAVVTVTEGVNTVTLSGSFVAGQDYYVPVLAGEKTNLTVSFDGKVSKTWASATLNQGRVANMGKLKFERNLEFSESEATATYGVDFTEPTLTGETAGVTYTSSNTSVATVDANGDIKLLAGGTTIITASALEDNSYLADEVFYTLNVNTLVTFEIEMIWSQVNLHLWIEKGENDITLTGTWPGKKLTKNSAGKYEYTIPAEYAENEIGYILSNNGANQTSDAYEQLKGKGATIVRNYDFYLEPNDWRNDGAWFAIYCWKSEGNAWAKMDKIKDNLYGVILPKSYVLGCEMKFVRMDEAKSELSWDSKWNETDNLTSPADEKVKFTINGWSYGSWSAK